MDGWDRFKDVLGCLRMTESSPRPSFVSRLSTYRLVALRKEDTTARRVFQGAILGLRTFYR